jgi:hypothetical protein
LWQIIGNSKSEFSVQENIDCVYNKSRSGCEGGWMKYAFKYAKDHGVVPLINDPYEGKYNPEDLCYDDYKYSSYNK